MLPTQSHEHFDRNVDHIFRGWCDLLRLQEWDITLYIVQPEHETFEKHKQDPDDELHGLCLFDADNREADIYIADWYEVEHHNGPEETMVHELLHLVINPILEEQGGEGIERLVNHVTRTLFLLRDGTSRYPLRRIVDENEAIRGAKKSGSQVVDLPGRAV